MYFGKPMVTFQTIELTDSVIARSGGGGSAYCGPGGGNSGQGSSDPCPGAGNTLSNPDDCSDLI